MRKLFAIVTIALSLGGCAGGLMTPRFRHPDNMKCIIVREGSEVGDYHCEFTGKYEMKELGIPGL